MYVWSTAVLLRYVIVTTLSGVGYASINEHKPRSFAVSGPRVWNDLPPTLASSSTTLGQFQSRLNTTLFRLAYGM